MRDFLDRVAKLPLKRLALLAWELQQRVDALERSRREPIAVIGMGCRFPGGAESPQSFWQLLTEGRDAIVEVPRSRWDIDAYYDADPDASGKMSTRFGGFLDQVDLFDPQFFGVAPREAQSLDPQQRLLLEVVWEALEHAGQSPDRLHGTRTGVFVGISGHDYYVELITAGRSGAYDAYLATGSAHSVASGRLSYVLGLHGPSLAVDTACSSSLVAVHLACQSLRTGDCRTALAGGVNAILSPDVTVTLTKARMMAPDGRCKAFDAQADGFVRGEGCGVVVLKRLSDAQADGDRILAVIRGTAVNQDGKSSGLTAPNGPAQEDVIRLALADAGVDAERVSYLETHGTGTSLGDPIEVRALGAVLAAKRPKDRPLLLGSVKSNIGHLESAAGVAGLIKLVLCLQHGEIPPNLHFKTPSPHIPWDEFAVQVVSEHTRWSPGGTRIGGLSSFGFSGTNCHVILEEAPAPPPVTPPAAERPAHVLTLSAKSEAALQALAARYATHLAAHPEQAWADVCHTATVGRAHLPQRLALVAASADAAQARLAAVATGAGDPEGVVTGRASASGPPTLAFLFTGQGAQYVGMGRELYQTQPIVRETLDRCAAACAPHLEHPLLAVMWGEAGAAGLLDQTGYTQPALFALEVALATLWRSWGVEPTWVLGHSVGEVAAAVVAGALALEDGCTLIATRARLMQALPPDGAMVAVMAPEARVQEAIGPFAREVSIAAVNGPASVVISGRRAAVAQVQQALAAAGVKTTPLAVSHAFHSPLMEPMLAEWEHVAAGCAYTPPRLGLISNLTGQPLRPGEIDAAYWRRHVRGPVQFQAGITALQAQGVTLFLEVGPAPVLCGLGQQCLPAGTGTWLPSLRKGRPAWDTVLATMAELYVRGVPLDWAAVDRPYSRRKVSLPTYPFQRERYWVAGESRRLRASNSGIIDPTDAWLYETVWKSAPSLLGAGVPRLVGVPPLREVAERVEEQLPSVAAEHRLETYDTLLPELDVLCGLYVRKGFRDLGFEAGRGERISAEALRVRLGILETHRRLLDRLLAILEEEGVLRKDAGDWEMFRSLEGEDPDHLFHLLLERFPAHQAELTVAARCGERLAEVLQGRADPLQILFPGGSLDLAEKLYQEAPAARVFNTLVREVLAAVLASVPAEHPIRVVEIGAGTGATTAHVLTVLPEGRTEYVFTDVSRLFLSKAEKKFRDRHSLRYKLLDIERDPVEQGFAPQSFDVVIASNVLHATADLRRTLAHVRRLLAPEGLLVLLEATGPHRFEDLTVGLTEGWWRFSDLDLRPSYALLSQKRWVELLREEGFTDAVAIPKGLDPRGALAHQAVVLARGPRPTAGGRWLIMADAGGLGTKVAADLRQRGGSCVVLLPGAVSTSQDLRGVLDADDDGWRGAVHLRGLDAPSPSALSLGDLIEAERDLCGSALALTQAVARSARRPRLWIVTRGAQPAGSQRHPIGMPQAPLWGLGKVIALEHPELRCTRVDLDPAADASASELLVSELLSSGPEDQVAFRGDERLVARLARMTPPSSVTPKFSADATYLITGGLAGLGLRVARWLVERGARHLVLMGRRAPAEAAEAAIREMEAQGAQVVVAQGDVAQEADVRRVLAAIANPQPPLRGIIHAAGVLDDGVLLQQTWARFAKVLAPKVEGAWNLHRLTQDAPLDFFVLFSSAAALLGSPGQANHAAANAFLDALAHHRRALGLPAISINWGVWGDIGAAADRGVAGRVGDHGMDAFTPADGLRALGRVLGERSAQVGIFPVDWARLAGHLPQGLPFYAELAGVGRAAPAAKPESDAFQSVLEQTPPARRWSLLEDRVRAETVKVLGLDPSRFVGTDRPLQELGLDSLMAVELRNALGKVVGETLPATLLFDHPTIERLVAYLGRQVLALETADGPKTGLAHAPAGQAREADIEALSEDEMATLLAQRLDAIDRGDQ